MRANLHTHTRRCKHASGTVRDYCEAACAAGLQLLGFSDHTPMPDGRWPSVRMEMDELDSYCADIDRARVLYPELRVAKGMECEYVPRFTSFLTDELLGRCGMEYLVCGVHWFPLDGQWTGVYGGTASPTALDAYAGFLVDAIASGLYAFVAHPDLFGNAYLAWDRHAESCTRRICAAAREHAVALEINAYGFLKRTVDTPSGTRPMYPWLRFWEVAAEYDISVVISSDAHRPEDIVAKTDRCEAIARHCELTITDPEALIQTPCAGRTA